MQSCGASDRIATRCRFRNGVQMMTFSPELAEIRFGCGLSPDVAPPVSVPAMLDALAGEDGMARRFAVEPFAAYRQRFAAVAELRELQRQARGTAQAGEYDTQARALIDDARAAAEGWFAQVLLRWSRTGQGLRERLAFFWADHFTAQGRSAILVPAVLPYVEDAIRPHVAGRFSDLLIAAVTHPLMLNYLDQSASVGPGSPAAARPGGRNRGLNENLAREVLELHTLGVGGPYAQHDVRQLAELFTGLAFAPRQGLVFRPGIAEPGPETILGRQYGDDPATAEPILAALRDLAVHPATAQHIARKLAVHFVADDPDPALVAHVAARWRDSGGDLSAVYGAMLEHPAAWAPEPRNVKPPADFVASACRALALSPDRLAALPPRAVRQRLIGPLALMGQPWMRPDGPDGWPEADAAWITPQGLAARLRWAMTVPALLRPDLPDPRAFAVAALGSRAGEAVRFAAAAAETRAEAVGLVLTSPAFQRR